MELTASCQLNPTRPFRETRSAAVGSDVRMSPLAVQSTVNLEVVINDFIRIKCTAAPRCALSRVSPWGGKENCSGGSGNSLLG